MLGKTQYCKSFPLVPAIDNIMLPISIPEYQGDSGSGLICIHDGLLAAVGITCYGVACGMTGMPGVYTTIANQSRFIEQIVEGRIINAMLD